MTEWRLKSAEGGTLSFIFWGAVVLVLLVFVWVSFWIWLYETVIAPAIDFVADRIAKRR